jgi:hypothetical protein
MSSRKLSEHVEDELFNKEKRVIPSIPPKNVIITKPKMVKESVLGSVEDKPVRKKKPYYRKKYTKPTPVEVIPEPVKDYRFAIGVLVGVILAAVIETIINVLN